MNKKNPFISNKIAVISITGLALIAASFALIWLLNSSLYTTNKVAEANNTGETAKMAEKPLSTFVEDQMEPVDFTMYTSPYFQLFSNLIKEFHTDQQLLIGSKVKSFPLFREDLIDSPRDIVWMSHGQYLSKFLSEKGGLYNKTDLEFKQETVLWAKKNWAERFHLKDGSLAKWSDLALLAENDQFHFIMSNPATSISGYSILANLDANKDPGLKKRMFEGLISLAGHDGMISLQLLKNPGADGFFMDESLGEYLQKEKAFSEEFIKVYLSGKKVNTNYQMFANKNLNGNYVKKWSEYLKNNRFKIESDLGLSIASNNETYLKSAYNDVNASDVAIGDFLLNYGPNIHNFIVVNSSRKMKNSSISTLLSSVLEGASNNAVNDYPWGSYKDGDALSLVEWNENELGSQLIAINENLDGKISEWFKSKGMKNRGGIYHGINHAIDLIEAQPSNTNNVRFQILVVVSDKDGSDQEFANFLEGVRKRLNGMNLAKVPRINSLIIGDLEENHFHSLAGLTGGVVRSVPLIKKNIERAIIQMKHFY